MKPLYIQLFYDDCPEKCPMIGTAEYPVYYVGDVGTDSVGNFVFVFHFPQILLSMFDGKMVNIWTEYLGDKYIRNVKFSKNLKNFSLPDGVL